MPILVAEIILGYKFLILRLKLKSVSFLQPSLLLIIWSEMIFPTTNSIACSKSFCSIKGKPELIIPSLKEVERIKNHQSRERNLPKTKIEDIQQRIKQKLSVPLKWVNCHLEKKSKDRFQIVLGTQSKCLMD